MSLNPVQINTIQNKRTNNNINKNATSKEVSFGSMNPVIPLMDAIDRGGFAATFILQDFLGMAAPRVGAGMYRNHDKTGQLNWDFAKKEGIREILSGPSAFLIPLATMFGIKKISGSANNVPIDFINGFGQTFAEFAKENKELIKDASKTEVVREKYYQKIFENMLSSSTEGELKGGELKATAEDFAKKLIKIESASKKGFIKNLRGVRVDGSKQDLIQDLLHDFIDVKKRTLGGHSDKVAATYKVNNETVSGLFKKLLVNMKDFSDDVIKNTRNKLNKDEVLDVEKFVKTFAKRRSGTRFLSNFLMFSGVVAFYTVIPKLYNKATKGRDPGLDGLDVDNKDMSLDKGKKNADKNNGANEPSFTGGVSSVMAELGEKVSKTKGIKKFSDCFEFSGATMPMPAMLTLMFGFCLPPRLKNSQSKTDRKEILFRDITSFISILFGAKALNRAFSVLFSNKYGLALNIKPKRHDTFLKKFTNYVYPEHGIEVLDSERIVSHYSEMSKFKNGINDMFDFVNKHGGNVGKMLGLKELRAEATEILGCAPTKDMKVEDIKSAFDKAKNTEAYKRMINMLENPNNALVKRAKTCNSLFNFASTVLLVPALMIAISKCCERMTKKRIEADKKASMDVIAHNTIVPSAMQVVTNKPTMAGFLNKN